MSIKIRTSMFAIAAVAALGAASLLSTTSSADARGFGGGGFHSGGGFHGGGMRMGGGPRIGGRVHLGGGHHIGIRHPGLRIGHRHPDWCRINGRCHVHVRWHRPWIVGTGVVATTYAVTPAIATAKPCTCLTKEYTPDNLVVFKDQCTKEVASAPAGNTQALLPMPQQDAPAATQQ